MNESSVENQAGTATLEPTGLMYDGHPVRVVEVETTVKFRAFVYEGAADLRVAQQIADAVEYRAPNLSDSEAPSDLCPGDALIALVRGGSSEAVETVSLTVRDVPEHGFTGRAVDAAVNATLSWM
ncbi:hypothetical protein [Micromonospora sp. RV43]|uniref:hypothetical protein n=1 Tax=Micromonospora sp. RV43 TaxID=1661387 RepID=UPI000AA0CBF8|nr:hypothetical protein [Micromonospora sp. RV43]